MKTLIAVAAVLAAASAGAQDFPSRPMRVIVLTTPGGPNDFLARLVAERLTKTLGQPMVVENRPGSSGIAGTEFVARQPGDGYTLLNVAAAHVLNPSLVAKLPYDPVRDFEPVTQLVSNTFSLTVGPSLAAASVAEFIAMAKARPGKISYASAGVGSAHHLSGELFKSMTGTQLLHVPYKGAAGITQALMSREVDATFIALFPVLPLAKAGKVRVLGVTTASRSTLLPDVPTLSESGVTGFEVDIWQGMLVPARTPRAVVNRLNAEMVAAVKEPQAAAKLLALGMEPVGSTPERFLDLLKADMAKWAKVIRDANIKAE